jgi:thiol-disulfide isomerase/thioredoxin
MPIDSPLLVACLCADWCGTCREYQTLFLQLQQEFPDARFRWVDIEDESDLVDPIEVANFPTLLIARGVQTSFFGTITPHVETLRRLIQTHLVGESSPVAQPEVQELTKRLQAA